MKDKKLTIDFSNGQFAEHVTGALVYLPELQIVLDCGLSQSNSISRDYMENKAQFNFSSKKIKGVFISHSHLDHIGRLPLLYKRGCSAPIMVPKGNYQIIKNMLEDSVKILSREALLLSKQSQKTYEPIYTTDDVANALSHIQEYEMGEIFELNKEVKFRFIPAGHIKYSAQIELQINVNNVKKKLVYTGDLGNYKIPKKFSESFIPVEKCDVLICETTYGDSHRTKATPKLRERDIAKLTSIIQQYCVDNKFRILIPCFALDRTPEMYMVLREIIKKNN